MLPTEEATFNHDSTLKEKTAKMPNISQGILDDLLPSHPFGATKKAPSRGNVNRSTLKGEHSNRPNISQGQFDRSPTFTREVAVSFEDVHQQLVHD